MTNFQVFNHSQFGNIEVAIIDGKKHIEDTPCATALGYENPLFCNPYIRDGYIVDIDKYEAWLTKTGWEIVPQSGDADEYRYILRHPEKMPQTAGNYFCIRSAIDNCFDPPTIGHVYLLTSSCFPGVWKVGKTRNAPEARCRQINRAQLEEGDWRVVYSLKTWHFAKIENTIKKQYQTKLKYKKEYFGGDVSEVINFITSLEQTLPIWKCCRGCESTCKAILKNGIALCNELRMTTYRNRKDLTESDERLSPEVGGDFPDGYFDDAVA